MKLTKHQQIVLNAYRLDPDCVNSDEKLLTRIWQSQGWNNMDSLATNLSRVSNPESLTRARRKLHQYGLIKYSDRALKRRTEQFEQFREENSDNSLLNLVQVKVNKPDPFMDR